MCECKCGDQVPGRTVTDSEYNEFVLDVKNGVTGIGGILARLGLKIVSDPKPTNAEKLAEIIGDFAIADEHSGQRNDLQLGKLFDARGVKAPGGDDE